MNTLRLLATLGAYFATLPLLAAAALQYAWIKITGEGINAQIGYFFGVVFTSKILIWLLDKGFVFVKPNELRRSYDVILKPKDNLGRSQFLWLRSGWNFIPFWHELHTEIIPVANFEPADFSGKIVTRQGEVNLISALISCAVKDESNKSLDAYASSGKDEVERRKTISQRLKNWVIQILSANLSSKIAADVVAQKDNFIAKLIKEVTDKKDNLDDELGVRVAGVEIGNIDLPTTLNEIQESDVRAEKLEKMIQKMKAALPPNADASMVLGAALAAMGDENASYAFLGANGNRRGGGKIVGVHGPQQQGNTTI